MRTLIKTLLLVFGWLTVAATVHPLLATGLVLLALVVDFFANGWWRFSPHPFVTFVRRGAPFKPPKQWVRPAATDGREYVVWQASKPTLERFLSPYDRFFSRAMIASGNSPRASFPQRGGSMSGESLIAGRQSAGYINTVRTSKQDPLGQPSRTLGDFVSASATLANRLSAQDWEKVCETGQLPESYWVALALAMPPGS